MRPAERAADRRFGLEVKCAVGAQPVAARLRAAAALANGALESFVLAAAIDMPRGIRINCVSPTILVENAGAHSWFPGWPQVTLAEVSNAYVKSVIGWSTGQTYKVG